MHPKRSGNSDRYFEYGSSFQTADKGVWMSLRVDDVDEVHKDCVAAGLDVTFPPTDMPWNVREMHVRHPDGHVFRVGKAFEMNEAQVPRQIRKDIAMPHAVL
jgi:uncharacterized glyoxalase superfamily protein PhnB